ncbi:hypothetical protein DL93DRAFT_2233763 [Clavulina sp. PMI_390]|nr:hypothetical protein DL93DRAFT_2233763 [Clavulina sp. PMI_390]
MDTMTRGAENSTIQATNDKYYLLTVDNGSQFVGKLTDPRHGKVFHKRLTRAPSPYDLAALLPRAVALPSATTNHRAGDSVKKRFDRDRQYYHSLQRSEQDGRWGGVSGIVSGSRGVGSSSKSMEYLDGQGDSIGSDQIGEDYDDQAQDAYSPHSSSSTTTTETIRITRKRGALAELQRERKSRRYSVKGAEEENASDCRSIDSSHVKDTYDDEMSDWVDHVEAGVELESIMIPSFDQDPHEDRADRADVSVNSALGASPPLIQRRRQLFASPSSVSGSSSIHADICLPPSPDPPPRHPPVNHSLLSLPSPNMTSAPTSPLKTRPMPQRLSPYSPPLSYSHSHPQQSPPVHDTSSVLSNPSHPHQDQYSDFSLPPPLSPHSATPHTHNQHHPHVFAENDYRYLPTPPPKFLMSHSVSSSFQPREETDGGNREDAWGIHEDPHPREDSPQIRSVFAHHQSSMIEDCPMATVEHRRWGETDTSEGGLSTLGSARVRMRMPYESDESPVMGESQAVDYESGAMRQREEPGVDEDNNTWVNRLAHVKNLEAMEFDGRRWAPGPIPGRQSMRAHQNVRPGDSYARTQHSFLTGSSRAIRAGQTSKRMNGPITSTTDDNPFARQHENYLGRHHTHAGEGSTSASSSTARTPNLALPQNPSLMRPNKLDKWELEMMSALLNIGPGP